MSDDNKPELSITVGDKEIKMTYGLEMDLRRVMPDPGTATQLAMSDPVTQDYIIRRCLTPLKKMVKDDSELIQPEDVTIDTEEGDRIILWALEHQMYFFVKRAKGVMTLAARQPTTNQQLRSTNGSEDSLLTTPLAGLSES